MIRESHLHYGINTKVLSAMKSVIQQVLAFRHWAFCLQSLQIIEIWEYKWPVLFVGITIMKNWYNYCKMDFILCIKILSKQEQENMW